MTRSTPGTSGIHPHMCDPVTKAVMVDPVLASDGKLYDRLTLQRSDFAEHCLSRLAAPHVIGPDVVLRSWIHDKVPVVARQFAARRAVCRQGAAPPCPERTAPASAGDVSNLPPAAPAVLSNNVPSQVSLEDEYRRQQILTLAYVGMATFTRFVGRIQQDPLLLRRDIFQRLGILSEGQSKSLVSHLQRHGVLTRARFGDRKVADLSCLDAAFASRIAKTLTADQVGRCKEVVAWHAAFIETHSATVAAIAVTNDEMAALEVYRLG